MTSLTYVKNVSLSTITIPDGKIVIPSGTVVGLTSTQLDSYVARKERTDGRLVLTSSNADPLTGTIYRGDWDPSQTMRYPPCSVKSVYRIIAPGRLIDEFGPADYEAGDLIIKDTDGKWIELVPRSGSFPNVNTVKNSWTPEVVMATAISGVSAGTLSTVPFTTNGNKILATMPGSGEVLSIMSDDVADMTHDQSISFKVAFPQGLSGILDLSYVGFTNATQDEAFVVGMEWDSHDELLRVFRCGKYPDDNETPYPYIERAMTLQQLHDETFNLVWDATDGRFGSLALYLASNGHSPIIKREFTASHFDIDIPMVGLDVQGSATPVDVVFEFVHIFDGSLPTGNAMILQDAWEMDRSSYPENYHNNVFRIEGLLSALDTPYGSLDNGDLVAFHNSSDAFLVIRKDSGEASVQSDWLEDAPWMASHILNRPTRLSQFTNDLPYQPPVWNVSDW